MKRVLIIGSGGAGKSTIATAVAARLGLPVIHLDALYWRAGWNPTPPDEWQRVVAELTVRPAWVMDGNYGGTLDARLAACDTVLFLDMPRALCTWRVVKRWLRYRGTTRPDMPTGCDERLSLEFVRWIWTYPAQKRPAIQQKLRALRADQRVITLRSHREARSFIAHLAMSPDGVRRPGDTTP